MGYPHVFMSAPRQRTLLAPAETPPDLIVFELTEREFEEDLERTRRIRERFGVPVVLAMDDMDLDRMRRARESEPYGYILRPFRASAVMTAVDTAIRRSRLERQARDSERMFRGLFANMSEGVALHRIVFGEDGKTPENYVVVDVNPRYEDILGISREDAVGKTANAVYKTPEPPFLKEYAAVNRTGLAERMEIFFPPMDKFFRVSVFKMDEGYFATVFTDITESVKTQIQLRENEKKIRTLVRSAPATIAEIERDGLIRFVNRGFPSLPPDKLVGTRMEELLPEGQRGDFRALLRQVFEDKRTVAFQAETRLAGEYNGWFDTRIAPLERDGAVETALLVATDVTDRVNAKKTLELMRYAVDRASDGIMRISPDGVLEYANEGACDSLGRACAELTGKNIWDIVPAYGREAWLAHWRELREKKSLTSFVRFRRADGREFPAEVSSNYVDFGGGEFDFAFVKNIAGRVQAEARVRRDLREKETLVREIHHRVKNNLQYVSSLLSLQSAGGAGKKAAGILRTARNRIATMAGIHQMLYRSSSLERIDFSAFVEDLCASVSGTCPRGKKPAALDVKTCPMTLDLDKAVPAGLILNELLTNAFLHAFPRAWRGSRRSITVELTRDRRSRNGRLTVADNGVGMNPDRGRRRKLDPRGLGLDLVKGLAGQIGGRVSARSGKPRGAGQDGSGTRITLAFPLKKVSFPGPFP